MRTKISTLSFVIATAAMSFCGMLEANINSIQVGAGYRQDSITSSTSQSCAIAPRAKSNLHFRDIEIAFIGVKAKSSFDCCCNSYLRADFDYGWVVDGKIRESITVKNPYVTQQRSHGARFEEGEFLYVLLHNDARRNSFVWDFDLGYVFPFACGCEGLQIGPGVGFSLNRQHFHIKSHNSFSDASFSSSVLEDFDLLSTSSSSRCHHKNNNRTSWWGPWIGFDFSYTTCNLANFYGEFEFHFGRIRHDRRSNVDNDFIDHRNRTKSFWGPSIKLGTNWVFCECWYFDASIYYSKFISCSGRNELKWSTGNIRFDVGYLF